jgi:dTDP-4-amino-4,6-dideoxygalactose transaminase
MRSLAVEPTTSAPVPFLDLAPMHAPLKSAILEDVARLIDTGAFTNGPQVAEFERAFADWCGAGDAVGLASGLDALRLALLAGGIDPGDEVVVPANTFVATLEAVTQAGGVPVVVDASERDYNLDVDAATAAAGPRTRFVMPVHLYGQLADMRALGEVAEAAGLTIVEDACQAHGATRDGLRAGSVGLAAAYSFYPGKNLGAFGDAGALTTERPELAASVRALREHGQRAKYVHVTEGFTARLDTIQAIALLHKLPLLDGWNEERRAVARGYAEGLDGVGDLRLHPVPDGSDPVWHLYELRTARRDALAAYLKEHGVASGLHYPQPVHLAPAYASLGLGEGAFPVAEALAGELLSLPVYPGMTDGQVERVVETVRAFFDGR